MEVGQIGYINGFMTLLADINKKLWIFAGAQVYDKPEEDDQTNIGEEGGIPSLLPMDTKIVLKIKRMEKGYKVYLYEFFDLLREKRFNCSKLGECESGKKK